MSVAGPTCVVCGRVVTSGRPHSACAPMLAVQPYDDVVITFPCDGVTQSVTTFAGGQRWTILEPKTVASAVDWSHREETISEVVLAILVGIIIASILAILFVMRLWT